MTALMVWIDQDLCTGDGICEEICGDVFTARDDGLWVVKEEAKHFGTTIVFDGGDGAGHGPDAARGVARIPDSLVDSAVEAAEECPGECIMIEPLDQAAIDDAAGSDADDDARRLAAEPRRDRLRSSTPRSRSSTSVRSATSGPATRRRDRLLKLSTTVLLVEAVALVVGRGNCPLGPLQRRLGDPTPLFQLVLPPRAARAAVPILASVSLVGLVMAWLPGPSKRCAGR